MAESNNQNALRLTDWLILAFVVVVMCLLIADLSTNVMDILDRSREHVLSTSAPVEGSLPEIHL